jgi:hypothetical protein
MYDVIYLKKKAVETLYICECNVIRQWKVSNCVLVMGQVLHCKEILCYKWVTVEWTSCEYCYRDINWHGRAVSMTEIDAFFGGPTSINGMFKLCKMRWLGHSAGVGERSNSTRFWSENLKEDLGVDGDS